MKPKIPATIRSTQIPVTELSKGHKIVTRRDRKTGHPQAGVTVDHVAHHPGSCVGRAHVWTNDGDTSCYELCAMVEVFV